MLLSRFLSLGLVISLAFTLSACGGKDEKDAAKKDAANKDAAKKDGGNNGGTSGTQKKASEKIVGKWDLDAPSTLEKISAEAKTDEEKEELEFAKAMISSMKMSFEFTGDGKMLMSMSAGDMDETKEGTYKVKSEDVSSVVIAGTLEGKTKDVTIKLVDDNKIELIMPEEEGPGAMVLTRAK